ncbi:MULTISPECIES: glycosyltransferase family 25 protein [unclassified Acinetobacter]|uniref:glycosyltransferase family 25 protein n=1 Tax=unclassified Acinetobacter TaxID=196816 RepID=UPI0015D15E26|nr:MULTISPECIES: glycosyltransferase family 25 protein [unclassified Acinetobacter]
MNTFVITLSEALLRQNHIKKEFAKENIPFKFFDAITPNRIDLISKSLGIDIRDSDLTLGEQACFLSHVCLWKKIIDENLNYVCIFEDDIHLGNSVFDFLSHIDIYPDDFDIIKLECFNDVISVDSIFSKKILDRKILKLKSRNLGTAGYILNKKSAIKLISILKSKKKFEPIDRFMFEVLICNRDINIYQIEPAICKQDFLINNSDKNLLSFIEGERKLRVSEQLKKEKIKIPFRKKIIREILRIFKIFDYRSKKIFSTFN